MRQASAFSSEPTVTITRAPWHFASMIAVVPMPDEPPCSSMVSPAFSAPRSNTLCQTVKKVSGIAPASTIESCGITGSEIVSCTTAYSA